MFSKKTNALSLILALLMLVSVLPNRSLTAQAKDKELTMYVDDTATIYADVGFDYVYGSAFWSSNSPAVRITSRYETHCDIRADEITDGMTAIITCQYKVEMTSGWKKTELFNCYVTGVGRDPTDITITPEREKTNPGINVGLSVSVEPLNAERNITWDVYKHATSDIASSDDIVVLDRGSGFLLSQRYVIKPKKIGAYDIVATTANGLTAKCQITVVKPDVRLTKTKYVYNGNVKKPGIEYVKMYDGSVVDKSEYTVKYSKGRKAVGRHTVTVSFDNKYAGHPYYWGNITKSFIIVPKGTKITKVTKKKKGFIVKWKKRKTQTTGYQIAYSRNKKFKKGTVKAIKVSNKKTSKKISKLKSKKKYYVKIRTYKKVKGKYYYSSWSKVKTVKTK